MRGGISNFNESFSNMLLDYKWEVHNISYSHRFPPFLFPMKIPLESGIRPLRLEIEPLIHAGNPFSWFRVIRTIRDHDPGLVLVHYWSPWLAPALGFILKRVARKKPDLRILAVIHQIRKEKSLLKSMLNRYFIRKCQAFIIMSKTIQEDLEHYCGSKPVKFVPHPVYKVFGEAVPKDEARSFLKLDPAEPLLLFFGIVRPYKGLGLLLQAMSRETVRVLSLRLIVAGEFLEDRADYEQMINDLGLENNVILMDDFIPTTDVKYYFSAADMVIQPYLEASQSGITQIAYQFERPMLVTDVGGLAEIVPHMRVGYVSPVDADAIAGYIVDFYANNREALFVKNLKVEKKRFAWENMYNGMQELIDQT